MVTSRQRTHSQWVFSIFLSILVLQSTTRSTALSTSLAVAVSNALFMRKSHRLRVRKGLERRRVQDSLRSIRKMLGVGTSYRSPWPTAEYADHALSDPTPNATPPVGMADSEFCKKFRMEKTTFKILHSVLQLPQFIVTENRLVMRSENALLLFLFRHGQKCSMYIAAQEFNISASSASRVIQVVSATIYRDWFAALLWDRKRISSRRLKVFQDGIRAKGSNLLNIIGFIDGTRLNVSRPRNSVLQWALHNSKYGHNIAFLSVQGPDGIMMHFDGPYPGKDHDSKVYSQSNLETITESFAPGFAIFGDSAYGLSPTLITIIKGARGEEEKKFNKTMSRLRVCAEWGFGGATNKFCWLKDPENIVLGKGGVAITIAVLVIVTNVIWCCERPQTSTYFKILPPAPTEYLHSNIPKSPQEYVDSSGECICPSHVVEMWETASAVVKKAVCRRQGVEIASELGL